MAGCCVRHILNIWTPNVCSYIKICQCIWKIKIKNENTESESDLIFELCDLDLGSRWLGVVHGTSSWNGQQMSAVRLNYVHVYGRHEWTRKCRQWLGIWPLIVTLTLDADGWMVCMKPTHNMNNNCTSSCKKLSMNKKDTEWQARLSFFNTVALTLGVVTWC